MLRTFRVAAEKRNARSFGERDHQFRLTGLNVEAPDSSVIRDRNIAVRIRQSGVSVTGPTIVESPEIGIDRQLAVRAEGVDRCLQDSPITTVNVADQADKAAIPPVVPTQLSLGAREPLQHAALLPVPSAAGADVEPVIALGGIDDPDSDLVALACWLLSPGPNKGPQF